MSVQPQVQRDVALSQLLKGLAVLPDACDVRVRGISTDSRSVQSGDLFMACCGASVRGHDYVAVVLSAGAAAVVYSSGVADDAMAALAAAHPATPFIAVESLEQHSGVVAARFYAEPSQDLFVVGITGTNGKTSCSHYLSRALSAVARPCAVVGTLGYGMPGALHATTHTTPDAVALQGQLAALRDSGAQCVAMEVSSHSLQQYRVSGVAFDCAVLTNLSHDHLDYHGTMAAYGAAKQRLFETPGLRFAVVNSDDPFGQQLAERILPSVRLIRYGLRPSGQEIVASQIVMSRDGFTCHVHTPWGDGVLRAPLLGRFNVSNLLAVLAVLLLAEVPLDVALERLAHSEPVAGRMERFGGGEQPTVVVDFAHTPDALAQSLRVLREHCRGQLWCVFGCGGQRDRGKRPRMGALAERYAQQVVITDDNPRCEDGAQIVAQIVAGFSDPGRAVVIRDREEAIAYAVGHATAQDVVLVAGKGHEAYQLVGDEKRPFSDREQVQSLLREAA
ncbi:MAG: UDP-N-acetylmuramoyl-L-alanyl-D-glutamate--2,6-diaminopimelate ligase [Gammaproteobacteria bacterium]|nr:UDP-N-acetylmuramoyl-L-alanyl-D-glutamate--2,6-diaminopimelate ligase [Gammaproteobacteria bacterium]